MQRTYRNEDLWLVVDRLKGFRETRLSNVRPFGEFFDYHRISVPRDTNEAIQVRDERLTLAHHVQYSPLFWKLCGCDCAALRLWLVRGVYLTSDSRTCCCWWLLWYLSEGLPPSTALVRAMTTSNC